MPINNPQFIILHHSYTGDTVLKDTDAIRNWHVHHNKWDDIGYHYILEEKSGEIVIYRGRPTHTQGAHARGFNHKSIGICIVGNYDKDMLSYKKLYALIKLIKSLGVVFGITPGYVLGHNETYTFFGKPSQKTCPGKNIDMNEIREALQVRI